MASLAVALSGMLFVGIGYANYARPAAMFRLYNWPLSAGQDVDDGTRTTYRRRGYVFTAFGGLVVLWALFAA